MSSIRNYKSLSQAHIDYIVLAAARTSDLGKIKESFQKFFETPIDGECLMSAITKNEDKIIGLRNNLPFEEKIKEIDLGDPAEQLRMLSTLHKECLTERVCNVTRDGTPVYKVDLSTAARCIELANKVIVNERLIEIKRAELRLMSSDTTTVQSIPQASPTNSSVPQIQIVHKREEEE